MKFDKKKSVGQGCGPIVFFSMFLAVLGLALCGIPFFGTNFKFAVPFCAISLLILSGALIAGAWRSILFLVGVGFALTVDLLVLYLAIIDKHLLDFLEDFSRPH